MKARSFFLLVGVLLFCTAAFSQVNFGRISGSVTDESGGLIAGAKVTITDQERGTIRSLVTDEAGAYAAPSLIPGQYTVKVEANGFNTTERKDVPVTVGGDMRADMVLKAGSQVQTVTVTESLPLINTTSATLGGVMESKEINDLPVIGRNWLQLLQFTPGVNTKPGGGSNGNASNGMRSDGNNYLFEGIFSGGNIVNTNSSNGDGASLLPPDAIQELGVNFQNKAEFGWRPGVASNVGVKSGTNAIHGTAFAQGQDGVLNARNPFNPAPTPVPTLTYEQYGATAGGPIKKDKIFWFGAFEGMQYVDGTPTPLSVPTTALLTGNLALSQSIPAAYQDLVAKAKIPAGVAFDASTGKVVNTAALNPQEQLSAQLVNSGIFQTGVPNADGTFNFGFNSLRDPSKNLLGKIDWAPNEKNHIAGEYFWSRDTELDNTTTITQPYWMTDYYLTSNVTRATWTYLPNSSLVNEFHFGFDRKVENQWPSECVPGRAAAAPNYGPLNTGLTPCNGSPNPSQSALFDIGIQGFTVTGTGSNITTLGGGGGQRRVEGYWTIDDIVSYVKGNHTTKYGFEIRRPYFDGASYTGKLGEVAFGTGNFHAFTVGGVNSTPLEDFLLGVPSNGQYTAGNPNQLTRNWNYGLFAQDDWRIMPRVTLNLGLRWEYESALSEDNNKIAVFDPTSPIGLTQLGSGISSPWNPNKFRKDLQPRLGLAWDVTGKGTTVVRAAYGLYSSWPVYQAINGETANPTAAVFYKANGTPIQGPGTIGTGTVTFPTPTGGTPLINWTSAGPMFPTGQIACGDGLGSVNPSLKANGSLVPAVAGTNPANPGTCAITAVDQHWRLPYVQQWNIGVQHAITSNLSLDVAYVGTHGDDLLGQVDLNEATPGSTDSIRIQTSRPYFAQFPWMAKITGVGNLGFSNYNALQVTLNQRTWHGLSTNVGYAWAHALDTAGTDVGLSICPDPSMPVRCNYGPTAFDIRNKVTARILYNIPGKKGPAQLLEGWQVGSVINLQAGIPYDTKDTTENISGTGENTDRWDLIGNASDFNGYGKTTNIPCFGVTGSTFAAAGACTVVSSVNLMPAQCVSAASTLPINPAVGQTGLQQLTALGCYMSGSSVIVPPTQGTFGTMGKALFRGAPFLIGDVSVRKHFKIRERLDSEFQFDLYNLTNHPEFAIPGGNGNGSSNSLAQPQNFGRSLGTPNVSNGNVVQGSGDARRYQFGLRFTF